MVMGIICAPVVLILAWENFHYVVRVFFSNENNFVDFLFALLDDKSLSKGIDIQWKEYAPGKRAIPVPY